VIQVFHRHLKKTLAKLIAAHKALRS